MNLISEPLIPVLRRNGPDTISPWQIVDQDNPVLEFNAPRSDFKGAYYQFFIGLLQTCFPPEDEDDWLYFWEEMPKVDDLKAAFEKVKHAFELYSSRESAFMQDYELAIEQSGEASTEKEGETKNISALLIDAPGGKTLKDNFDHFIKRDQIRALCPGCTACALFTLQINAPSGGVGHRVGLRGGGPLTTLITPETTDAPLWRKLWLNIFSKEEFDTRFSSVNWKKIDDSVLPWLGPSRLSDKKGLTTTPLDVSPLQMYWGMPRRIRLDQSSGSGLCDMCGRTVETLFETFRTKNYGINYDGAWVHPLTPYRFDPKNKSLPISLKGQKGGLGYRHWLSLVLQETETGDEAATMVKFFNEERSRFILKQYYASLWCFGYDMDNMKARCWYDTRLPMFLLDEEQRRENVADWAGELIRAAREVVKNLRSAVKSAWFRRPGDVKGDMIVIEQRFWEETEAEFYKLLNTLVGLSEELRIAPPDIYNDWYKTLERKMYNIFNQAVFYNNPEDVDWKRIISARQSLKKNFYTNKTIKTLRTKAVHEEAV